MLSIIKTRPELLPQWLMAAIQMRCIKYIIDFFFVFIYLFYYIVQQLYHIYILYKLKKYRYNIYIVFFYSSLFIAINFKSLFKSIIKYI